VGAALVALVLAIYAQVAGHAFVYLDDDVYVFANSRVREGLSWANAIWAFTAVHASNWHPLTWLSHMVDAEMFGADQANAGGHHLVSVGLHAANAVLLFAALRAMTGARWRSAVVAALFAVHPLRVESVAWVSERKDVLSGTFFLLTLLAYARYAKHPGLGAYALVLASALLGFLSKPMLMTLPFVLLLLDFWPLARWPRNQPRVASTLPVPGASAGRLLAEKLPLFAAVVGLGLVTLRAQSGGGAMPDIHAVWRLLGPPLAVVTYLGKALWPTGLAPLYIHPGTLWTTDASHYLAPALIALLSVAAVTTAAILAARRHPAVVVGWLWFLGMLIPVIGILQVGAQWWADRYAYLPLIGVTVAAVWGIADLLAGHVQARRIAGAIAALAVVGYGVASHAQTARWRDTPTLFRHTLAVTRDNWMIENNLGAFLTLEDPVSPEARVHYERALRANHGYADAHANLAELLYRLGSLAEARHHWSIAAQVNPRSVSSHVGLGKIAIREGHFDLARRPLEQALAVNPNHAEAHAQLGVALAGSGELMRAHTHLEEAVRLDPGSTLAGNALARWLATAPGLSDQERERAVALALDAARRTEFQRPEILATLAAAEAAAGRPDQAVRWQRRALELASPAERDGYRVRLDRYEKQASLP
jgi:tetratricopeptide (TPR) repeat protein